MITRKEMEDKFSELLECGFDYYGHIEDEGLEVAFSRRIDSEELDSSAHIHVFDNGVFMLNPYYWGEAGDLNDVPNFVYYPMGLELCWYKYPMRAVTSNKEFTKEEFDEIIDRCIESIAQFKSLDRIKEESKLREDRWNKAFDEILLKIFKDEEDSG